MPYAPRSNGPFAPPTVQRGSTRVAYAAHATHEIRAQAAPPLRQRLAAPRPLASIATHRSCEPGRCDARRVAGSETRRALASAPAAKRVQLCALTLALVACGTTQSLSPSFKPPERPTPQRVLADTIAAAAASKPAPGPAIAVGVTSAPTRLLAWDVKGKLLWEQAIEARSAPLVAGGAVVIAEPSGIVVRELSSGATRVVLEDGAALVGVDGAGDELAIAMEERGEAATRSGLLTLVAGRTRRWTQRLAMQVGTPALVAGRVLVPWGTHQLSILRASDGEELARWNSGKAVLGHALVRDGRIYVGQHGLWALREGLFEAGLDASNAASTPSPRVLPGQPPLLRDGYSSVPDPTHATHRLRLDWEMAGDAVSGDALFLRFYRLLFAFDARSDRLRWVHVLSRDVVGARVVPDGLLIADAGGSLQWFGHDGSHREIAALERSLLSLAIAAPERWVSDVPSTPAVPAPVLPAQLVAAATLDDARLIEGRAYAVQRLAALQDSAVTARLVELCSQRAQPAPVRRAACDGLSEGPGGGEAVVAALRLAAGQQPPLAALAAAAARLQVQKAAPMLLPYLTDLRTSASELPVVIGALAALDHKPAATVIERFLRIHHAEPEGSELAPALGASAEALGTLRARTAKATLEQVAGDGFSQPALRATAERALAELKAPPKPKRSATPAAAKVESDKKPQPAPPPEPVADPRPAELTTQLIDSALAPVKAKLAQCLRSAADKPRLSRLSMVVDGQGKVERVFVTPAALQACLEPLLRAQNLPATRAGRQQVTYVIRGDTK